MLVWPLKGPQSWAREGIRSPLSIPEFAYCFRVGFNVPVACLVFTLHLRDIIQSWVISTLTNIAMYCTSVETSGGDAVTLVSCCRASQHSSDQSLLLPMCQARSLARFVIHRTHVLGSSNWLNCSRHAVATHRSYTSVKDICSTGSTFIATCKIECFSGG
jgi:hypothetical protein